MTFRAKYGMSTGDFQVAAPATRLLHLKKIWPSVKSESSSSEPLLLVSHFPVVLDLLYAGLCLQVSAVALNIPFLDRDSLYALDEEAKLLNSSTVTMDLDHQFVITYVSPHLTSSHTYISSTCSFD